MLKERMMIVFGCLCACVRVCVSCIWCRVEFMLEKIWLVCLCHSGGLYWFLNQQWRKPHSEAASRFFSVMNSLTASVQANTTCYIHILKKKKKKNMMYDLSWKAGDVPCQHSASFSCQMSTCVIKNDATVRLLLTSATSSPTPRAYWSGCWGSFVSAGWRSHGLCAWPRWWGDRTFSPPLSGPQRTGRSWTEGGAKWDVMQVF